MTTNARAKTKNTHIKYMKCYHSPFKPFGSYPYRRAVLAIQARGEHCSPVRWFSRKGEW
jgi:hypothetical protein